MCTVPVRTVRPFRRDVFVYVCVRARVRVFPCYAYAHTYECIDVFRMMYNSRVYVYTRRASDCVCSACVCRVLVYPRVCVRVCACTTSVCACVQVSVCACLRVYVLCVCIVIVRVVCRRGFVRGERRDDDAWKEKKAPHGGKNTNKKNERAPLTANGGVACSSPENANNERRDKNAVAGRRRCRSGGVTPTRICRTDTPCSRTVKCATKICSN